ncbi:MAG: hypothetical protein ACYTF7_03740 [Planctomycetota bacterium]|jgi:hypothetical protein
MMCLLLALSAMSSCAQYFEITDLHSGNIYYATGSTVERTFTGHVVFWDAFTGHQVSLPSWKLRGIPREEFDAAKHYHETGEWPDLLPRPDSEPE